MRQFHNPLPDPEQAGLKWKPYEEAREKITRIEERSREAGMKAKALAGDADPAAPVEELDSLGTELREVRRERQALDEALPEAEEELRRTAWEHQEEWTSQADEALAKAIEEERSAYARAQEIAQKARERRLYFEALGD
jgi:hypothetical protein